MVITPLEMQLNVYPPPGAFGDMMALLSHFAAKEKTLGKPENVMLLPFGTDAPQEFPRLVAPFPKVGLRLESSGVVWVVKWLEIPTAIRSDEYAAAKRELAQEQLLGAASSLGIRITRLASVVKWALTGTGSEGPAKWLAARFFKELFLKAPFNRPETLEIHSHKVFTFGRFKVNSWARVKTETLLNPDPSIADNPVVTFASDLNTPVAESTSFSQELAADFFKETWAQHLEVRRLYLGELS